VTDVPPPGAAAADAAAASVDPDEIVALARALIAARSENPGTTVDTAAARAGEVLSGLGAEPTIVRGEAGRPSVVATIGAGAGPSLAWNGHLDTVPAGSADTWSVPPFAGTVQDGRLIGRGACDMKGPVAAALAAAAALRRSGIGLAGSLTFHLAADEELAGWHGTKVLLERGLITQDAAIVGEPSDMAIALAERGGAWITATASGRSAHGSRPDEGVSAITTMARLLLRLPEALPDREHPLCGRPTVNAALIHGGSAPNVVPDRCTVDIDRRILPGETSPEEVLAPFHAVIDDIRREHPEAELEVEIREWTDAAETSPDSEVAAAVRTAAIADGGGAPPDVGFTGITDARFYINDAAIPALIYGPGSLSVAHTADEWVAIDDLVRAARVYARPFVGFCGAGLGAERPSPAILGGMAATVLTVTDTAARKVAALATKEGRTEPVLRIRVLTGGCSGFSYQLAFDDPAPDDHVIQGGDGVRVVVDPQSARIIKGSTLDLDEGLMGGGLKVRNPQAISECACGESFSI
jgi:acetylornithine deacetylase/succinyl-diaminopimelate desuccinylase family protein/iron-sulfur cluster assembly accessory protein